MGYRSDVCIAISEKVRTDNIITQAIPQELMDWADDCYRFNYTEYETEHLGISYPTHKIGFLWRLTAVKWYVDDPAVKRINDFLHNLPDEDYDFIRLGEDYGDAESHLGLDVLTIEWDIGAPSCNNLGNSL